MRGSRYKSGMYVVPMFYSDMFRLIVLDIFRQFIRKCQTNYRTCDFAYTLYWKDCSGIPEIVFKF